MTLLEVVGAFWLFIMIVTAIGWIFGGVEFSAEIVEDDKPK